MSKISRATMSVFASSASLNQIEQFGSLAAGSPVYLSPGPAAIASIQALSNYLEGWFGGIVGSNAPAIQDLNALCYLYAYQLAYGFQAGIPEWDAGTTYYIGSFVSSAGILYVSLIDNNTNNAVTTADWAVYGSSSVGNLTGSSTTYVVQPSDNGKTIIIDTSSSGQVVTLPSPVKNFSLTIKDNGHASQNLGTGGILINPHASETIDGQSSILMTFDYGYVTLLSDGTNWYVVDKSSNISAWRAYTPGITNFGTPFNVEFLWRRVGDSIDIIGTFQCGTIPSGQIASFTLPTGLFFANISSSSRKCPGSVVPAISGAISVFPDPQVTTNNCRFLLQNASQSAGSAAAVNATSDQIAIAGNVLAIQLNNTQIQAWTIY